MNTQNNTTNFLRTSRQFPTEIGQLAVELTKSYIDIANIVNARTIGLFATNKPSITGEAWFYNKNQRQQTLRQLYLVTGPSPVVIEHRIDITDMAGFSKIYGTFTDGTNWYPIPYVDITAITDQVQIVVTPTEIQITGGATAPTIVSGFVVLEWISFA